MRDVAAFARAPRPAPHDLDARSRCRCAARARHADLRAVPRRRGAHLRVLSHVQPVALHQIMFGGLENYALLAVPFFIFAGELMGGVRHRGPADRLGAGADRPRPGSLGVATVGACTLIGAISGAEHRDCRGRRPRALSEPLRDGYGTRFSAGPRLSSGSIDIVIPPSIAMILYGASAEQSIAKLFAAGCPARPADRAS